MNVKVIVPFVLGICVELAANLVSAEPAQVVGVYYLKVREAPSLGAYEISVLSAGDVVEVIDEVRSWAQVKLADGSIGYASRKYLVPVASGPQTVIGRWLRLHVLRLTFAGAL